MTVRNAAWSGCSLWNDVGPIVFDFFHDVRI